VVEPDRDLVRQDSTRRHRPRRVQLGRRSRT
jgi:hypothetical protein